MNKPCDLTGQVFGKLTASKLSTLTTRNGRVIRAWECLCECGKTKSVRIQTLRNGDTRSCGCLASTAASDRRRVDLVGQKFGRWTVISLIGRDRRGCIRWECLCSCGRIRRMTTGTLRSGNTRSCGCLRIEMTRIRNAGKSPACKLPAGESRFRALIDKYQRRALRFGRQWLLQSEDTRTLFTSNCYYCGCVPKHIIKGNRANGFFTYNGIDRLDSRLDYIVGNVVSCCGNCNKAKLALSEEKFLGLVSDIYNHRIQKTTTPDTAAGVNAGLL